MKRIRWIGLGLFLLSFVTSNPAWAVGNFLDYLVRQRVANRIDGFDGALGLMRWWNRYLPPVGTNPSVIEGFFDQVLDPSNPADQRTFKQRYFINSSFASGQNSPVFFVICGEATCTPRDLDGAVTAYAMQYHAYLVALEHRYYGVSQPFPILTPDNLRYLRVDFALMDLAHFQAYAQEKLGLTGKWISIGGSYPGALSAFYREKFPNLVVGALASSAPVMALSNFEQYDYVVAHQVSPACARAMRAAVQQAEAAMNDPARFAEVKKLFNAESIVDPVDFLYVMADMGAGAVQYGMRDEFCGALTQGGDLLANYAQVGIRMLSALGVTPEQDSFQWASSVDFRSYLQGYGSRQWLYQDCTELGLWQNAYHDPTQSVRSHFINPAFHQRMCQQLFGIGVPANTQRANLVYYSHLFDQKTSRILFTNGSTDPWAALSVDPRNHNVLNPNLTSYVISGGSHCNDLATPLPNEPVFLQKARSLFQALVTSWL